MREKCTKIFRDIPSSLLLIIGFCLTMFVTMKSCEFVNKVMGSKPADKGYEMYYMNFTHSEVITEKKDKLTYMYVDSSSQWIKFKDIYNIMAEKKLNFCINNFVHIGESQEIERVVTYIYNFDDTYPFEYKKRMKTDSENEPVVVIGESIVDYTNKIGDSYYLNIEGRYYEVAGITVNNEAGGYDSSIYFIGDHIENAKYYKDAESEFETTIMTGDESCMYTYGKNKGVVTLINEVKTECEEEYPVNISVSTEETDYTEKNMTNIIYRNINIILLPILFIFCINSCYCITYLWVKARKYDIAVKYTFGFSKGQIYGWIMKEISILIGIAVIITIIVKIIFDLIFKNSFNFDYRTLYDILIITGSVVFTLLITSIGAYRYSNRIIPAEVLKEL